MVGDIDGCDEGQLGLALGKDEGWVGVELGCGVGSPEGKAEDCRDGIVDGFD